MPEGQEVACRFTVHCLTLSCTTRDAGAERLLKLGCLGTSALSVPCDVAGRIQGRSSRNLAVLVVNGEIGMASQSNRAAASNWKSEARNHLPWHRSARSWFLSSRRKDFSRAPPQCAPRQSPVHPPKFGRDREACFW